MDTSFLFFRFSLPLSENCSSASPVEEVKKHHHCDGTVDCTVGSRFRYPGFDSKEFRWNKNASNLLEGTFLGQNTERIERKKSYTCRGLNPWQPNFRLQADAITSTATFARIYLKRSSRYNLRYRHIFSCSEWKLSSLWLHKNLFFICSPHHTCLHWGRPQPYHREVLGLRWSG